MHSASIPHHKSDNVEAEPPEARVVGLVALIDAEAKPTKSVYYYTLTNALNKFAANETCF